MKSQSYYNKSLKPIARQLRNNTTKFEKILWNNLRKKQIQNIQYKDLNRDNYLNSIDIYILRFNNYDIKFDLKNVVGIINTTISNLLNNS